MQLSSVLGTVTDLVPRQTVSDVAGSLSFTVWLFAQSPQLLENYRRKSVDGLSPVFLTQWMLGDATNLIGCILTKQLPFQIAVAIYFCCIDVCILSQFVYYTLKARRERKKSSKVAVSHNPYSVLSETSELLGRGSRGHSYLRSASKRRGLSQSQVLHRPSDSHHHHQHHSSSRSRSRHAPLPLSRSGSTDAVTGVGNYRAMSDAALSVAQLAQEAARRREAMMHNVHAADEDYFSHKRRTSSNRSKSRASSSPNHSLPPSRSRSRVNSNDLVKSELDAVSEEGAAAAAAAAGRSRSRRKTAKGKHISERVDFVPFELSPTREVRAAGERGDDEEETESEAEHAATEAMADSVTSLASVSTDTTGTASTDSLTVEPRGRDMVRTATRIETISGKATPIQREGTCSPFSQSTSGSDGTARYASPPAASTDRARMSMSHHQLGRQQDHHSSDQEGQSSAAEVTQKVDAETGKKRRASGSTRSSSPVTTLHRSVDGLREGLKKRSLKRSDSSRSHSSRRMLGSTLSITNAREGSSKKRTGTKSPASLRRSIGMVLLGVMMISSLPASNSSPITSAITANPATSRAGFWSLLLGGDDGADVQRVIGRISAWLCALLYITSRIPQVWENHIRRSVEGLSILLFIAAFTGNFCYTISVLANPNAKGEGARAYLQESLPFLLGSGGTLVFDLIIVGQWAAWSGKNGVREAEIAGDGVQ